MVKEQLFENRRNKKRHITLDMIAYLFVPQRDDDISLSVIDKMKKRKKILILIAILILLTIWLFNLKSNLHFFCNTKGELYNYEIKNQEPICETSDILVRRINIRRKGLSLINRIINKISRPELLYFEFKKNQNNFSVEYYNGGSTANSNIKKGSKFSINSAFYNSKFEPNGLIIVDGKKYGKPSNSSGHFKVIEGKAVAGPTSLFNSSQKPTFSCQSHPSVMKNGVIWNYILDETKNEAYWKSKTYRSLIGQNKNGSICLIASGNGGLLSIKEITQIAKSNNILTATCLDAGAALQYAYKVGDSNLSFSTMNNKISLGQTVDKVFSKLTGKRFYSESPAFINYE